VGGHFERVAAVYESLRTTDEAPVHTIGQLLPDRPVTGLDTGCGTGRYSRLLRASLMDGSRLVVSDVSGAMLAQLTAGNHGRARGVAPLLAAAEELPLRAASLDLATAFSCVHHFDLGRFLTAAARVLKPGGQLFIYTRSRTRARSGAATSPVSPSASSACTARTRSGTPSRQPAGST
jgi:ubiquinone/menaquinone biosynthesis C-methylase UbiE